MTKSIWFPWVNEVRDVPRLFCFPHAGGTAREFRDWQRQLPHLEVLPVELPGRETRLAETPFHSMLPLLDELAPALEPYLDRPFAFFGHSMGGLISYELAQRLRDCGLPQPAQLLLSACPATTDHRRKEVHKLPREDLLKEIGRLAGTPQEVLEHRELMDLLIPIIRADFELVATAQLSAPPLDLPLTVIGGDTDKQVSEESLEAWRPKTSGPFRVRLFRGGHFFLRENEEVIPFLIEELRARFK